MIISSNCTNFDHQWLEFMNLDPVHPGVDHGTRIRGNRAVLMYQELQLPQCMICIKMSNHVVNNMQDILHDQTETAAVAMFYTIFRLPGAVFGAGQRALLDAVQHLQQLGIEQFYTLSPVPSLCRYFDSPPSEQQVREFIATRQDPVAKFHLGNGASLHAVNFDADASDIRQGESWGIMVNYSYTT